MSITEHLQATPASIAAHVADALRAAIAQRGLASLAVSGGRSPVPVLEALSAQALDWSRVTVILVDERIVPRDHPDSNTAMVMRHLMQGQASEAHLLPYFRELAPPFNAEVLDAMVVDATAKTDGMSWPLDVALLGMGVDAHTASLFHGAPGYARAIAADACLAWVVPEQSPSRAPHARLTLTLHALLAARELVLSLAGKEKLGTYRLAIQRKDPAMPVSLILHQTQTPVSVWIGDHE